MSFAVGSDSLNAGKAVRGIEVLKARMGAAMGCDIRLETKRPSGRAVLDKLYIGM